MKTILILCEGNICRSPMAAALLAVASPDSQVGSAGLGALIGHPAHPIAIRLMAERGVSISGHRARQVTRALCLAADVILVMENVQRKRVENLYPEARGRVFRLDDHDIPDPYRKPETVFQTALAGISMGVEVWARRLKSV